MKEDYKLIPMSEIDDEAREISVRWMECEDKDWIGQKHKLASDIMCYAVKYHKSLMPTNNDATLKAGELAGEIETGIFTDHNIIIRHGFVKGFMACIKWLRDRK
jgi:hypothetical protein